MVEALRGGDGVTQDAFVFGYSVQWEGDELVRYWSYYLPSDFQDVPTALENLERDRPVCITANNWDLLKRKAYAANKRTAA